MKSLRAEGLREAAEMVRIECRGRSLVMNQTLRRSGRLDGFNLHLDDFIDEVVEAIELRASRAELLGDDA